MTIPRLLLAVGVAAAFYLLGARAGRERYDQMRQGAQKAWQAPASKKARSRIQKLAKRNAKKVSKGVHS
jgi:hypothetical protein